MKNKERWIELCEQTAKEQDPKRPLPSVKEINSMLEEKERRLESARRVERTHANRRRL